MFQSFFNKPCMACHKRPAKIKFIKIIDGDWQECMICQFCAQSIASEEKSGAHLKLDHVFESLLSAGSSPAGAPGSLLPSALEAGAAKVKDDPMCPSCGLSYSNYRPTLMLGCSECYEAFGDKLADDLKRIHGAIRHRGRKPPTGEDAPPKRDFSAAERSKLEEEAGAVVTEPSASEDSAEKEAAERRRALRALRKKLQEAVEGEEFDKAIQLRDQIKELESEEDGDDAKGES
jgi:protein arginine kinase activator